MITVNAPRLSSRFLTRFDLRSSTGDHVFWSDKDECNGAEFWFRSSRQRKRSPDGFTVVILKRKPEDQLLSWQSNCSRQAALLLCYSSRFLHEQTAKQGSPR